MPQVPGKLVLILVSEKPFTSPQREEFLSDLSQLINSVPVVEEVRNLTRQDLKDRNIPVPAGTNAL